MGHNPFLIHIFLLRLNSYSSNSFTMLNVCLRVLRSERGRKTEHIMHFQNFRKQGPCSIVDFPLERTLKACKSAGYVEFMLERALWRSSGRPLYRLPARAWTSPLERTSMSGKILGARISCSSVSFPARADIKNSRFSRTHSWASTWYSKVPNAWFWLKLHIYIYLLAWYKHWISTLWSLIPRISHMHASN